MICSSSFVNRGRATAISYQCGLIYYKRSLQARVSSGGYYNGTCDPVRLRGAHDRRRGGAARRLSGQNPADRERGQPLRLHAAVRGARGALSAAPGPGAGRARVSVQPVRQAGARRRGGHRGVLFHDVRRDLPDVRQGGRQRRRRASALSVLDRRPPRDPRDEAHQVELHQVPRGRAWGRAPALRAVGDAGADRAGHRLGTAQHLMAESSGWRGAEAGDDRDRPFLQGTIARGAGRLGHTIRSGLRSLGRGTLMLLWGAAVIGVFAVTLLRAVSQAQGLGGVLAAVATAAFVALLVAGAGAWVLMWVLVPARPVPVDQGAVDSLTALLAPTLAELNAVRAEVVRQVAVRSVRFVPIGAAAGLGTWGLSSLGDDPPGVASLFLFLGVGAFAGEVWAAHDLSKEYARLYKNRVLPLLARRFGDLTYRQAPPSDLPALIAHRVLRDCETVTAEDEIAGTHRGLPLRITNTTLTNGSGEDTQTVFDGLLIELELPRSLRGTTAVIADKGILGNLGARLRPDTLRRIRLEDARFEQRFQVYGSDQGEALALLTPAFMERLTALAERSGFALPGALAEGNRLTMALPKPRMGTLFEPPPYWKPAGGEVLVALSQDLEAVLKTADAVIDLEFWAARPAHTP